MTGLDLKGHLWIVLSHPTESGTIAVANLTTHRPLVKSHSPTCVFIQPGEHPFVTRVSCIAYHRASMKASRPFDSRVRRGELVEYLPFVSDLLNRVQHGALGTPHIPALVRDAIRATLDADA